MILDKFFLLFETDASDSAKDVGDFGKSVKETEDAAKSSAKAVDSLIGSVKGLVAAYLSFSAVKDAVFDMAREDDVVAKFSNTLGFNIEQLDAYSAAVERSGGSAESFRGSISGLKSQLDELQNYGGGDIAQTLARIGVNAVDSTGRIKSAMELLPEIAGAFEGLTKDQSSFYGKKLGLDQGTILLLQQSRYNMEKLVEQQRQYGHRTKSSTVAAENFNDALDNSKRIYDSLAQRINEKLLPVLTNMINFLIEHKDIVVGFFATITGYIIAKMIPAVLTLNKTLAANPILRIVSILSILGVAVGALYEDIKAYMNGQDSLIGRLFERYKWLKDGIYAIGDAVKDLDWVNLLFTEPQKAIDQLKDGFRALYEYIVGLFSGIGTSISESIGEAFEDTKKFFGLGSDNTQQSKATASDPNAPDLPIFGNNILENTRKGLSLNAIYGSSPVNSMNKSMSISNQSSQKSINISFGDIKVDATGMSRDDATAAFGDALKDQISQAFGYLNDGTVA